MPCLDSSTDNVLPICFICSSLNNVDNDTFFSEPHESKLKKAQLTLQVITPENKDIYLYNLCTITTFKNLSLI